MRMTTSLMEEIFGVPPGDGNAVVVSLMESKKIKLFKKLTVTTRKVSCG
jgi:hypothetical protein